MNMDNTNNISYCNYAISQSEIHSLDLSEEDFFSNINQSEEKIAMFKFRSFNHLSLSTYIKYSTNSDVVSIKELIIFSYHIITKQKASYSLLLSDIKVPSKTLNMAMFFTVECITSSRYLFLMTVSNCIYIISIEEHQNNEGKLSYEMIYENKKSRFKRFLILGTQLFDNEVIFYLITKPDNRIITISCSIEDQNSIVKIILNENAVKSNSNHQFFRYTQSSCKWTLFTEKTGGNIMLDKETSMTYSLDCPNDLGNHSFFLMNNNEEDQLYLITDLEEVNEDNKKCLYLYFFELIYDEKEKIFKSQLLEKIHVLNDSYKKYVLVGFNDSCFFVNFYSSFITYYFDKKTKRFVTPFQFEAKNYCETAQSFNFNTFNDNNNKTHMILETYKNEQLVLIDYILHTSHFNSLTEVSRIKRQFNDDKTSLPEIKQDESLTESPLNKIGREIHSLNLQFANDMIKQKERMLKAPRYNHNYEDDKHKEENDFLQYNQRTQNDANQKKNMKQSSNNNPQYKQVEEEVNKIINNNIEKISQKIFCKYSQMFDKLAKQTSKIEKKQDECNIMMKQLLTKVIEKTEVNSDIKNSEQDEENEYSFEEDTLVKKSNNNQKFSNEKEIKSYLENIKKQEQNQKSSPILYDTNQLYHSNLNSLSDQLTPHNYNMMEKLMNPLNQIFNIMMSSGYNSIEPTKNQSFGIINSKHQSNEFPKPKSVKNKDNWFDEEGNCYTMKKTSKDYINTFDNKNYDFVKFNKKKMSNSQNKKRYKKDYH